MSGAVILLQARMASTRLPGKAVAPIGARGVMAHCLVRLRLGSAAPVMLATTIEPEDDCLAQMAAKYGVPVFRGPEHDVLARLVGAADACGARFVVRATGDNPAIDIDAPRRVLAHLQASNADHVVEGGLPYGAAVEAVTVNALRHAASVATEAADREHVTTLIRRDATRFRALVTPAPPALCRPDLRLTVDTEQDLWFMRHLASRMGNWMGEPELGAVIAAADALQAEVKVA